MMTDRIIEYDTYSVSPGRCLDKNDNIYLMSGEEFEEFLEECRKRLDNPVEETENDIVIH